MKIALAKRGESPMADFIYGLEALDFSNFDGAIYLEGVIRRGDGGIIIVLNGTGLELEKNDNYEIYRSGLYSHWYGTNVRKEWLLSSPIELEFEMNEDGECVFRSKETGEALITYKCVWYDAILSKKTPGGIENPPPSLSQVTLDLIYQIIAPAIVILEKQDIDEERKIEIIHYVKNAIYNYITIVGNLNQLHVE